MSWILPDGVGIESPIALAASPHEVRAAVRSNRPLQRQAGSMRNGQSPTRPLASSGEHPRERGRARAAMPENQAKIIRGVIERVPGRRAGLSGNADGRGSRRASRCRHPPLCGVPSGAWCDRTPGSNDLGEGVLRRAFRYQSKTAMVTKVTPTARPTIQPATSWLTSAAPRIVAMPTIPPVATTRMDARSILVRRRSRPGTMP